jgi:hypothetical protein
LKRCCKCGCDHFRFKLDVDEDEFVNICRNCNHTLAEHIQEALVNGKQAD